MHLKITSLKTLLELFCLFVQRYVAKYQKYVKYIIKENNMPIQLSQEEKRVLASCLEWIASDVKKIKEHRTKYGLNKSFSLYRQYWMQVLQKRYEGMTEKSDQQQLVEEKKPISQKEAQIAAYQSLEAVENFEKQVREEYVAGQLQFFSDLKKEIRERILLKIQTKIYQQQDVVCSQLRLFFIFYCHQKSQGLELTVKFKYDLFQMVRNFLISLQKTIEVLTALNKLYIYWLRKCPYVFRHYDRWVWDRQSRASPSYLVTQNRPSNMILAVINTLEHLSKITPIYHLITEAFSNFYSGVTIISNCYSNQYLTHLLYYMNSICNNIIKMRSYAYMQDDFMRHLEERKKSIVGNPLTE